MDKNRIEKLSEYLRRGAKLTSESCPSCGSILIKFNNHYYCVKCEREVLFASSREEYLQLSSKLVLMRLKEVLINRIDELRNKLIDKPENFALLEMLNKYLSLLKQVNELLT